MNFDRNVSCLIAVDVFMDNDFFNQTVEGGSVQLRERLQVHAPESEPGLVSERLSEELS